METDFWHQRWQNNEIGFHNEKPNAYLIAYWQTLDIPSNSQVFVPLCGKSQDMLWLASLGHRVLGVELSQIAVSAFFEDAEIKPNITQQGGLILFESPNISIYCGDLFALTAKDLHQVTAIFDRGALVALPKKMRQDYITHLDQILPQAIAGLLVTMDYDQSVFKGPPFSISEEELNRLFKGFSKISELAHDDIIFRNNNVRMKIWHYIRK